MTDLTELAKRVEAATGPDRELAIKVWLALVADDASRKAYAEGLEISQEEANWRADYMMGGFDPLSSLDAAMTLVPEGSAVEIAAPPTASCHAAVFTGEAWHKGFAATPALALAAAALRALATQGEG